MHVQVCVIGYGMVRSRKAIAAGRRGMTNCCGTTKEN